MARIIFSLPGEGRGHATRVRARNSSLPRRILRGFHQMCFGAMHRHRLLYNACWEDPRLDRELFQIRPDSRVLVITSAGCNALDHLLAVVDFAGSPWSWFRRWMAFNHVRMDAHLLPRLRVLFRPEVAEVRPAYGGVWRYLLFVGTTGGPGDPCPRQPQSPGPGDRTGQGRHGQAAAAAKSSQTPPIA